MNKHPKTVIVTIILCIVFVSSASSIESAEGNSAKPLAITIPTLADTLNNVIKNVTWDSGDSWTATWGPILGGQIPSQALDNAITNDINRNDYPDALYVARIADLNNYSSTTIQTATQTALQRLSMSGSLPGIQGDVSSQYGDPGNLALELHYRFALWGYKYAQNTALSQKWNVTQAYNDFVALYNKPPLNSAFGEMLWADPQSNWAKSFSSRYYDECAETLSVFLIFAELGMPGALGYADKVWAGLQNHWTGTFYEYTVGSGIVECEMGNFAQIIAEYSQLKGGVQNIPNWNRVIQDLSYKLLSNGWNSTAWSSPGVIVHATTNPQTRLWETMGALIALNEFYQGFNITQQITLQNMLMGSGTTLPAWRGLLSSNLSINGQFKGVSTDSSPYNDATMCGASTLFLYGIAPVTGNLLIPAIEENYDDYRTEFRNSQFQFNYNNHKITIPVTAGQFTFIYGSMPTSYTFPSNGVYTIQFSNDWNTIVAVNREQSMKSQSSIIINLSINPASPGNTVVCSAIVTGASPTGTITWTSNSSTGVFGNISTPLALGVSTTTYFDTISGTDNITASYWGDANNTSSYGTISINIISGPLSGISISPTNLAVASGVNVVFTATGFDAYGNRWDVSSLVGWEIDNSAGGSWNNNVYTSSIVGNWTVTATLLGKKATMQLTVQNISSSLYVVDFNRDGRVDFSDVVYFVNGYINFNQNGILDPTCDLNHDAKIDFDDVTLFVSTYIAYMKAIATQPNN